MNRGLDFTDLVLLVGTNPLPNYVVAKYFYNNNQNLRRIWLLYSEKTFIHDGTRQYADDIERVLDKEFNEEVSIKKRPLKDNSNADIIIKDVNDRLLEDSEIGDKIHLNYTGGTKAMAVHIYRELEKQPSKRFSASYLDARDYRIKFDHNPNLNTGDLRKNINIGITWENLFHLHNHKKMEEQKTYLDCLKQHEREKILQCIVKLAKKRKLSEIKDFADETKFEYNGKNLELLNIPKNNSNIEDLHNDGLENLIDKILVKFNSKNNPELFEFLAAFREEDRLCNQEGNWLYDNFPISGRKRSKNSDQLKKFLDGIWLEAYVSWIVKEKKPEMDLLTNWELCSLDGEGSEKFEVDILIKNGYQICGISCGTSKNLRGLKYKGFEVILRTRQLGGDEALAVLASLLEKEDAQKLENDLKASTGTSPENFIILSIDDLHPDKMWSKIEEHIFRGM